MTTRRLLTLLLLACLTLTGCLKPVASTAPRPDQIATAEGPRVLRGSIGTIKGYHVQLTDLLNDFAKGAVVSLIEVSSGRTVGTSIADSTGAFVINFGSQFTPTKANPTDTRSVAYYLEASRGIKGQNSLPNQAGADAMRLRSIIWFDFNAQGWLGISNATAGPLSISISTTAVAYYINQQVLTSQAVSPEAYIGSIDPALASSAPNDYLGPGNGVVAGTGVRNLTAASYGSLFTQITNAVTKDQDPLATIILDPSGQAVNTQTSFTFVGMTPATGVVGSTVTITGSSFEPANMSVAFVGATASINLGASNANSLVVNVPAGARSGLIQLGLNGVYTYTTPFSVTTDDGHRVVFTDAGGALRLYAVSNDQGTLVRVNPDGSTTTLSTALNSPRGVLVNPEGSTGATCSIYVSNAGTNQIVRLDSQGNVLNATFLAVTDPNALALGPDGDLYVSQTSSNAITRVRVNWTTGTVTSPIATYTGFSGPSALAFDYNRYLYVVENSQGRVRRFQPQATESATVPLTFQAAPYNLDNWAFLSDPRGIAIDTAGNSFITSQANNVIMKVDPVRNMTAFAGVNAATSIARDSAGNLYVGDQGRNLIRRITLSGDQRILAYGLSGLRGLAVDNTSNLYVSLSNAGAILKVSSDRKTTSALLAGISAPSGLTFRNGKLYVAHNDSGTPKPCCGGNDAATVDEVTLTGAARTVITSGLYWPGGVEVSDDGSTYYAGRIYGTWGAWTDSMWWYNTWDNNGINIVNPGAGTNSVRRTLMPEFSANGEWNSLSQSTCLLDATRIVYTDKVHRKLVMSTQLNGRSGTQYWQDLTPSFGGTKVFPNDIWDAVYDGTRYVFVACKDGNIYRLDSTSWTTAPAIINGFGTGYPYGMTMMGGILYAGDPVNNRIYRVLSPATATTVDASYDQLAGGSTPSGLASFGGFLYLSDYNNRQILKINPTGWVNSPFVTLNGSPSRIATFNDGRLLVRVSDGVFYQVSTAAVATSYASTIGCTGCGYYDFYIDSANNVLWGQPMSCVQNGNYGLLHTHQVIRDGTVPAGTTSGGNWLYMGATNALYGMNLTTGEDLIINGIGNVMGVAVSPSHAVYAGNTGGGIFSVDPSTRAVASGLTLSGSPAIWGMTYDGTLNKLYAAASGNNTLYEVDTTGWTQQQLKVGLHAPMF